jgi:hypothetical protein
MAQEVVIVQWDDLHLAEGRRVPATRQVHVGLEGQWAVLDLDEEHGRELTAYLTTLLEAGRAPESVPAPASPVAASRARNTAMREFADKHGLHYTTKGPGKFYYPRELRDAYAAYLADGTIPGKPAGKPGQQAGGPAGKPADAVASGAGGH